MKILDQYLYAVGRQLKRDEKEDIIKELHSTILDNFEDRYGKSEEEEAMILILKEFGSPSSIAKEYGVSRNVISPAYVNIYFMVLKIVSLALLGSFTIAAFIKIVTEDNVDLILQLVNIVGNSFSGILSSVGSVTIVFIVISKYWSDLDFEDEWDPKHLESLPTENEKVSFFWSCFGIVLSVVFLFGFNYYPEMINIPISALKEQGFEKMHLINMTQFRGYLVYLNILWIINIIHSILVLVKMKVTKSLRLMTIVEDLASVGLFYIMFKDVSLYIGSMNLMGFRAFFLLFVFIQSIEVLSESIKLLVHE